jgi:hypothetical protein
MHPIPNTLVKELVKSLHAQQLFVGERILRNNDKRLALAKTPAEFSCSISQWPKLKQ